MSACGDQRPSVLNSVSWSSPFREFQSPSRRAMDGRHPICSLRTPLSGFLVYADRWQPIGRCGRRRPGMPLGASARCEAAGGPIPTSGSIFPGGGGTRLSIELYSTDNGERIMRAVDSAPGPALDTPIGRLAIQAVNVLARREGLDLGASRAILAAPPRQPRSGSCCWVFALPCGRFGRCCCCPSVCD